MSRTDNVERIDKHITQRYEIIQKIGKGAYGVVWKAMDKVTHQPVALKKIFGAFRNSTDSQRTFREISFLKQMQGNPHIVELLAVYKAVNNLDLYVVFEILESDVHSVIRANILMDVHKRYIVWQTLVGLKYLHSRKLIHRDLKPSNLLINSDSTVKLCDFGLARTFTEGNVCQTVMTEYVSTRWYRSPELIIGSNHYSEGVDMWAVGCIVAELYAGRPLFPGTSTLDQMERVVAFTGPPSAADIASMHSEFAETMIANLAYNQPRITLKQKLPNADEQTIDFVQKLLVFNPEQRMTVQYALEHPFVAQFHNPEEELSCDEPLKLTLSDNKRYTVKDYRNKIYKNLLTKLADEPAKPMDRVPITR
ncbi:Extracellular signal-regulated kinase 2 [Tritrichomonas foetus]|uniref:Mitogen-activated protein kinase n=1 Tax=Tritrichomonas foetus TaxID=1144522 RepID=A0A1J4KBH4_9EUKA|nr:Extracellular signal-regulated kinase 2 [Tritrichomonas foetus]|eukprot:OHT08759.1 Extracellular signal-regulated kinase 2 [Tritrichomonas foetus]